MKIKSITLQNFKGCKNATYTFDGKNVTVCGANGSGKTTINTSFDWAMADKDTELHSNPPIRPIDVEECTPRVDIILDIDGREVSVAKLQKQTKKGNSVSLSNTYEVNAVEYGERDFKAKMAEYGIDFDLFLPLSHPDYFTSQKSADMRKVLFAMASEKSDKEIADLTDGADDVAKLLENYTAEEVKAMQNATLRKIKEVYGKDGEILRAQIEGIENSIDVVEKGISDIDVAELELHKNVLKEQIAENKAKQEDVSKQYEEYQKLSDGIMELKFAESDLVRKANEDNIKARREIEDKIADKKFLVSKVKKTISDTEKEIALNKDVIKHYETELNKARDEWNAEKEREFDENSLICPYCKQEYPNEKKDELRLDFQFHKEAMLNKITEKGNKAKELLGNEKATLERLKKELPEHEKSLEMLNNAIADLENQLSELPTSIDVTGTDEYKAIQSQIAEKEHAMSQMNNADDVRQQLKADESDMREHLTKCEKKIASIQYAMESIESLEKQIAYLRNKQSEYEQNKANAEKILYQLDLVSKRKNELLTDDINKHFDIVRWQMFEYQKNGEIKDCCVPLIDGKRFGESTNKGREILAKLDIIKGLQKFYGQHYPVFLDNAESLSEETLKRIDMPCQLILLKVTEDEKLKVEVG